jgi:hypothetical protein
MIMTEVVCMEPEEFIQQRVDNQIEWYDQKSASNKKWFQTLIVIELILAAMLPFLSGFNNSDFRAFDLAIGIIGIAIVILNGLLSHFKFKDHWNEYRTTAEQLKHEKFLFLTKTDMYSGDDPFPEFVAKIELLISKENSSWSRIIKSDENKVGGRN